LNSYLGHKIAITISIAGILLAGYLTLLDFTDTKTLFCPASSNCDIVRLSRYADFFGVPVAFIGLLGYTSILLTLILPLRASTRTLVFPILSTIGFVFSLYLVFIQLFVLSSLCQWCMISFALISGLFLIGIIQIILNGLTYYLKFKFTFAFLLLALVISFSMYACSSQVDEQSYEAQLANHLTKEGAVMYGAYWCPHCGDQKKSFGKAFEYIQYVECDPKGPNANPKLCQTKEIKGYPTWEINSRFYEGNIPLESLANLSGFTID